MTLNSNHRMALRATAVAFLCIVITHFFQMERSYWMELTAFMLITQSFGEGIYRSLMRFMMTILGCLIGWSLYLPLQAFPLAMGILCLLSLFCLIYCLTRSFIGRMLATGVLVVSIFSFMGGWTFDLLITRIQDTLIGAGIAIFVNGLVLPEFSKTSLKVLFNKIDTLLKDLVEQTLSSQTESEFKKLSQTLHSLEKDRLALVQSYTNSRYETFLLGQKRQRDKTHLLQINILFFYLNALIHSQIAILEDPSSLKAQLAHSAESYYRHRLQTEWKKLQECEAPPRSLHATII